MDVVRRALPMVLTMLKMALVICIPLVLLIGTYDLKTVVTVSCVQFALFFVDSGSSSRAGSTARSWTRSTAGGLARTGRTRTSIR